MLQLSGSLRPCPVLTLVPLRVFAAPPSSSAVLVMMTGLGMLTGSTIATPSSGSCVASFVCSASRVSHSIVAKYLS